MNNQTIESFAKAEGLEPIVWFGIKYPSYSIKVKYSHPTSNPEDFKNRALLRLIDAQIPYVTACDILLIDDPHRSILWRFKYPESGPQLVMYDERRKCDVLTSMGQSYIEKPIVTKQSTESRFIDGFTCRPFPKDVVEKLENDRWHSESTSYIPNGYWPFYNENDLVKLNNTRDKGILKRLQLPTNVTESSFSLIDYEWIKDFSIGIFLKNGSLKRYIFCGDNASPICPFGYLQNVECFKLVINQKKDIVSYKKDTNQKNDEIFLNDIDAIINLINRRLESQFVLTNSNAYSIEKSGFVPEIYVKELSGTKKKRTKFLEFIYDGYMTLPLPGITGSLFVRVKASPQIQDLAKMKKEIEVSEQNKFKHIEDMQRKYPDRWRTLLLDMGRHDLLFLYDVEHFIKYKYE